MTWIGLWLSLNQAVLFRPFVLRPDPAAAMTAVFAVKKLTFTTIYFQPLRPGEAPLISMGVGLKVF